MKPYFDTEEKQAALLAEAGKWIGTPWRARSCAKGSGVSCHNYPRELYIGTYFLDESFPVIDETPNRAKHTKDSEMARWIDSRSEFKSIARDDYLPRFGDLLGIQIGPCVNHLGVVLSEQTFTHTLMKLNTCVSHIKDPTWWSRIKRIWRPMI